MQQWTQDEAIAYECARECIGHMIAILTDEIYNGVGGVLPSVDRLAVLDAERSRLFQERKALRLHDHAEIARLRAEYGAIVREHRAVRHAVAA